MLERHGYRLITRDWVGVTRCQYQGHRKLTSKSIDGIHCIIIGTMTNLTNMISTVFRSFQFYIVSEFFLSNYNPEFCLILTHGIENHCIGSDFKRFWKKSSLIIEQCLNYVLRTLMFFAITCRNINLFYVQSIANWMKRRAARLFILPSYQSLTFRLSAILLHKRWG